MIKKDDLTEYFFRGIKSKNNLKIGVEHEKFILNSNTLKPLSYEGHNGIKEILEKLTTIGWIPLYDDNKQTIIALKRGKEAITLEPGGCLLYTSPSPRDQRGSRMPSSA